MKTILKTFFTILFVVFALSAISETSNSGDGYTSNEVVLKTKTGDLFAQLISPEVGKKVPLVIIIAGSGPTDMDCNNPMFKTNSYKYLAEELAQKGIASLRFDKRGVGKSSAAVISESELRFENYVDDAVEFIELMKKDQSFSKVFVLGHSEGSLIGMLAATKTKVDGFISIAGIGNAASEVIREQLKAQPPMVLQEAGAIIDSLLVGNPVSEVKPYLNAMFRPSVQPYLISWFKYNPSSEIANLTIPVLIIQGTTDIQVSTENAGILHQAAKNSELKIIEGMNHILKDAPANRKQNMESYSQTELPVNKKLSGIIENFIGKVN